MTLIKTIIPETSLLILLPSSRSEKPKPKRKGAKVATANKE